MFDFERAHAELCEPAYLELHPGIHDLLVATQHQAADLAQNQDAGLTMPWPSEAFKRAFTEVDPVELATASRVIYCYGHWGKRQHWQEGGTYWKFSKYADQVLRDRIIASMPDRKWGEFGIGSIFHAERWHGLSVHQGVLRISQSTRSSWRWEELCLATPSQAALTLDLLPTTLFAFQRCRGSVELRSEKAWNVVLDMKDQVKPTGWVGRLMHAAKEFQVTR